MVKVNQNYKEEYPRGSGHKLIAKKKTDGTWCYRLSIGKKITKGKRILKERVDLKELKELSKDYLEARNNTGALWSKVRDTDKADLIRLYTKLYDRGISPDKYDLLDPLLDEMITEDKMLSEVIESLMIKRATRGNAYDTDRTARSRYNCILRGLGDIEVRKINENVMCDWFEELEDIAVRTKENYLDTLCEIMNHAEKKRWLKVNYVSELDYGDRRSLTGFCEENETDIKVMPVEIVKKLLKYSLKNEEKYRLTGKIILGVFCGVRVTEVNKIKWSHVEFDKKNVVIPKSIAKKRRLRNIDLPDNAIAWLKKLPKKTYRNFVGKGKRETGKFVVDNHARGSSAERWTEFWRAFVKDEDLSYGDWGREFKNALRHQYGSMHYELHGNTELLIKYMGHKNDEVLFNNYRALVKKGDGKKHFNIYPE